MEFSTTSPPSYNLRLHWLWRKQYIFRIGLATTNCLYCLTGPLHATTYSAEWSTVVRYQSQLQIKMTVWHEMIWIYRISPGLGSRDLLQTKPSASKATDFHTLGQHNPLRIYAIIFYRNERATLYRNSNLCIPRKEIAWPQSQFLHSCVSERFIYSRDRSTYLAAAK